MRACRLVGVVGMLLACTVSFAAYAAQPLTYRVTHIVTQVFDPNDPTEEPVTVSPLNDKGELVGYWSDSRGPFLWRDGTFEPLSFPGTFPRPLVVNNRGVVAGVCQTDPQFRDRGCLLHGDQVTVLEALPEEIAVSVADLGNRGHVLGSSLDQQGTPRNFIWHRGAYTLLEPLPAVQGISARRINDRGTIAVGVGGTLPVIWQDGTVMAIELPPGGSNGDASDVNNRGTVALNVFFPGALPSDAHNTAYLWTAGELTPLDPPGAQYRNTTAEAINDRGVVVGQSFTFQPPTLLFVATVWRNGVARDLNLLIDDADPLKSFVALSSAESINDRGQIVAVGRDSRDTGLTTSYYLLTPLRAP